MIEKSVSNVHPSAKVDLTQSTWSTSNVKLEGLHSKPWCWRGTTKTHPSSHIITYHHIHHHVIHVIPRFPGNDHWKARWQSSRAAHCMELAATTRPSRGQRGLWAETRVDPGWPRHIHGKLRTFENPRVKSTYIMSSLRSPQGVHRIQHTKTTWRVSAKDWRCFAKS